MDGTVLDSMPKLRELGIHVLQLGGGFGRLNAEASYNATVGQPFVDQCRIAFGDDHEFVNECAKIYGNIHAMLAPNFRLTSFGYDLVSAFSPAFSLALVSSTSHAIINTIPSIREIPWRTIEGFDGESYHKKEQIESIMDEFLIEKDECIYVGDVTSDEALAAELGLRFSWPISHLIPGLLNHVEVVR